MVAVLPVGTPHVARLFVPAFGIFLTLRVVFTQTKRPPPSLEGAPAPLNHDETAQSIGRGARRLSVDETPSDLLRRIFSYTRQTKLRLAVSGKPVGPLALVRPVVPKILRRKRPRLTGMVRPFCRAVKARSRKDIVCVVKATPRQQDTFTLVRQTPSQGSASLDTGRLMGGPPILLTLLFAYSGSSSEPASGGCGDCPLSGPASEGCEALFHRASGSRRFSRSSLSDAAVSRHTSGFRFSTLSGPSSTVLFSAAFSGRAILRIRHNGHQGKCRSTYRSKNFTLSFYSRVFRVWQDSNTLFGATPCRGRNTRHFRPL